jgi:hypothetical protein
MMSPVHGPRSELRRSGACQRQPKRFGADGAIKPSALPGRAPTTVATLRQVAALRGRRSAERSRDALVRGGLSISAYFLKKVAEFSRPGLRGSQTTRWATSRRRVILRQWGPTRLLTIPVWW